MVSLLTRLFVFSRDHFTCVYCGRPAPVAELVIDHHLPPGRGGGDELRNLSTACKECVLDKGNRTTTEYQHLLRERHAT